MLMVAKRQRARGDALSNLTRDEVRRLLSLQGFEAIDDDLDEVTYRANATMELLLQLDDGDLFHVEPWPVPPRRSFSHRVLPAPGEQNSVGPHTSDVAFMTIAEQSRLIASRQLSPVALTLLYLDRIAQLDGRLRAFNLVFADEALDAATTAEAEIAAGHYRGPLHGIPVALKDVFDIKGHVNSGGCDAYADNVAAEDCTVVARLREAGAVILGALATHEFHMGGTLSFLNKEAPRNPWDLSRSPAGSSAGSGASVAAGLVSGSIGGDTGGSIRGPGSVNGVAGLRPSWGRVSRHGAFSLAWDMDAAGPLARSAEDIAILLQAIAGHDPSDPTTSRDEVPDYRQALSGDIRGLKVGVLQQLLGPTVEAETRALVESAIGVLTELGASVQPIDVPSIGALAGISSVISDGYAASYHRGQMRARYELYDANTRVRVLTGALLPTGLWTLALRARARLAQQMLDVFDDLDLLVGATGNGPATAIVTASPVTDQKSANDIIMARGGASSALSVAGVPAISIPAGFTSTGLPVGWQLAARPMEEGILLGACHAYQAVTDHHQQHPPVTWSGA